MYEFAYDVVRDPWFWYYTLSAIPQALAAMIAVVATLVVYKVSRVSDRTEREKDVIKRFILVLHPDKEIHEIERMRGWELLHALHNGIAKLNPSAEKLGFENYKELEKLFKEIANFWQRSFEVNESRIHEFLSQKAKVLENLVGVRKRSIRYLVNSLFTAAVPSCLSFLVLPHIYLFGNTWANPAVTILTILSSASIIYTAYAVWRIAKF